MSSSNNFNQILRRQPRRDEDPVFADNDLSSLGGVAVVSDDDGIDFRSQRETLLKQRPHCVSKWSSLLKERPPLDNSPASQNQIATWLLEVLAVSQDAVFGEQGGGKEINKQIVTRYLNKHLLR